VVALVVVRSYIKMMMMMKAGDKFKNPAQSLV